jgi:hypothetical protein
MRREDLCRSLGVIAVIAGVGAIASLFLPFVETPAGPVSAFDWGQRTQSTIANYIPAAALMILGGTVAVVSSRHAAWAFALILGAALPDAIRYFNSLVLLSEGPYGYGLWLMFFMFVAGALVGAVGLGLVVSEWRQRGTSDQP